MVTVTAFEPEAAIFEAYQTDNEVFPVPPVTSVARRVKVSPAESVTPLTVGVGLLLIFPKRTRSWFPADCENVEVENGDVIAGPPSILVATNGLVEIVFG